MNLDRMSDRQIFDDGERTSRLNEVRQNLGLAATGLPDQPGEAASLPTIGIEIEMTWRQAFKDMHQRWLGASDSPADYKHDRTTDIYETFSAQYHRNDTTMRPMLKHTEAAIPYIGNDAYWEFSFLPTKNVSMLGAELTTLYEADLLHEDVPYATHMTIANIPSFRDAATILCRLEQLGGTSPERIEQAINATRNAWAIKGKGGIRERNKAELFGNDVRAFELRTLVTTSPEQMNGLLATAQHLAQLSIAQDARWKAIRKETENRLVEAGLPLEFWGHPKHNAELWRRYGQTLVRQSL